MPLPKVRLSRLDAGLLHRPHPAGAADAGLQRLVPGAGNGRQPDTVPEIIVVADQGARVWKAKEAPPFKGPVRRAP